MIRNYPSGGSRRPSSLRVRLLGTLLLGSLLIAATLFFYSAPAAQTADVFDRRVNQNTRFDQHEPSLAVNPRDPRNVLVAAKDWRTGPKQVWFYRTTDGGASWVDGHVGLFPSYLPNQSDPVVSFSADGTAYLTLIGYNQGDFTIGGIYVARSRDGGASWDQLAQVAANARGVFNDKEWTAIDRSANSATRGNIYVTWTRFTEVNPRREVSAIVASRSTDGGKTFSAPVAVSPDRQEDVQGSFPVVGPNGELHVLYYSGTDAALYLATSRDGGGSFGAAVQVAEVVRPPSPLPGASFRIFVLPVLAVDPRNGALFATWNDFAEENANTMLARSTDGGITWLEPQRLNDDSPRGRSHQYFPTVAVGADGTVHAMWLDTRDDLGNRRYRPYYTRSTDGGITFSPNAPLAGDLSEPDIGFQGTIIGDYNALDTSGPGDRFYAAWVDTRGGTQDIGYTSLALASSLPAAPVSATAAPRQNGEQTGVSALPSPQPLSGFNNLAFQQQWERADRPVLRGRAIRPWVWGPGSFGANYEEYRQGQGGRREVLYFDKARMEVNNTRLSPDSPGYVTNGLLVVELISGRVQLGDNEFDRPIAPAQVPVAGDINSPEALTYASLAAVASLNGDNRALDRTGRDVTATLNRGGVVLDDPTKANLVKVAYYEPVLGHNIPDVFWQFMQATGPVYNSRFDSYSDDKILQWESALGYPITEAYWTTVRIAGVNKSVLVQAFQRRVLTYVPDNPEGWRVEMGNVGRHYFDWRYGR